jgi:ligand-binding sensor domain-containing protein
LSRSIIRYWLVLLSVCLQAQFVLFSQPLPNFFHHLTTEEGLSQAINSFVYKDSRGFVWASSIDGLNRYDGRSVKVYRPNLSNPNALRGNNMQSRFFETTEGDLWFCTYEAINRYRRRTDDFESFQLLAETGDTLTEGYHIFHFDSSGKLWVSLAGNLYSFDTKTRQQSVKGLLDGVRCFADTNNDGKIQGVYSCFFGFQTEVRYAHLDAKGMVVSTESFFVKNDPARLPPLFVYDIRVESDTLIWLCCSNGLTAFNREKRSCRQYNPAPGQNSGFWSVVPLNDSILVVSSVNGIWAFDKRRRLFIEHATSETDNLRSLAAVVSQELNKDSDGNLWVSHWNKGLSFASFFKKKFANVRLTKTHTVSANTSMQISSLVEDSRKRIWCATIENGILLLNADGTSAGNFDNRRDLPYDFFTHLFKDRSQRIWAVGRRRLFSYDEVSDKFSEVVQHSNAELTSGRSTAKGRLLIGSYDGIFEVAKTVAGGNELIPAAGFEFLRGNMIDWIYEDSEGSLYLGKNATTLLVINEKKQLEFPFGYVKAAYETPDGKTIWLATTSGLVKMDKRGFTYTIYNESNGLPNQYLYSVLPDSLGFLWLSSNKGILRFDPRSGTARQYGAADGVWEREFFSNVWLRASSGEVWLGNRDVLNVFRPETLRDVRALPKVQITNLKVNDLDWRSDTYIGECSSLEFPFSENTLSFEFVALEYSDPANNRLKYRLEGYDKQWLDVPPGTPGFARYAKLPPGHYTLKIMAANSDGVWNPAPRELRIRILPPFWQTWWFFLLVAVAVAGTAYSIYKYRLAQIRKEFDFKQKTAESEMKALRAQMNPHFIFNSLNSINAYILRNEGKTANIYLTGFAHLMRQILDNSAREAISLENEIEFLQSYLRAEAMRLENKLTWDIKVANDVDTFETEIPSMILQPYIENAVWHGIAHKPEGGKITISIGRDDSGALLLTVEDDGIGRARARELRASSRKLHESKGLKITEERLALYDQKHGTRSTVTTTDLFDPEGNATGTRVNVRLSPQ